MLQFVARFRYTTAHIIINAWNFFVLLLCQLFRFSFFRPFFLLFLVIVFCYPLNCSSLLFFFHLCSSSCWIIWFLFCSFYQIWFMMCNHLNHLFYILWNVHVDDEWFFPFKFLHFTKIKNSFCGMQRLTVGLSFNLTCYLDDCHSNVKCTSARARKNDMNYRW